MIWIDKPGGVCAMEDLLHLGDGECYLPAEEERSMQIGQILTK